MFQQVVYRDKAKQGEAYPLLQQATAQLAEILGSSWPQVGVQWDQIHDERDHPIYTAKLTDFSDEAEARFAPEELADSLQMRGRLSRLWRDLLRSRNHRLIRQLQESGRAEN